MPNIRTWIVTAGTVAMLGGLGAGIAAASQGADDTGTRVVPASTSATPGPSAGATSDQDHRSRGTDDRGHVGDDRGGRTTEPGDDRGGAGGGADDPAGHH
jgi:hypothetical protein